MGQLTRTAEETALSIPEILSLIFAPRETQAACACVCKKWSEVALDELWRDPGDVYSLLKLAIDDDSFYDGRSEMDDETLERIQDADWPRFRKYATRVVFINFYEYPSARPLPSKAGIAFLCFHHRFGTCFTPNVRKIRWTMNSKKGATLMMPFISAKLEELTMETYGRFGCAKESFPCLVHRTPTLKKLYIDSKELPPDVSASFTRWIRTCDGLEVVHIPPPWHTSTIVAAFASLPNLIEFGHQWTNPPGEDTGGAIALAINGGSFRSLRRLGWSLDIKQAEDLLRRTSCQLQGLTFHCRGQSNQGEVVAFLATAVECCPELDSLCLKLSEIPAALDPDGRKASLDSCIFRPLLACSTLTKLRVHSSSPCIVSTSDLEKMGDAWPKMMELVLCPDPDVIPGRREPRGTAISTLPHVAAAFPRLRVLELYFDLSEPPGSAGGLLPESHFRCLEGLNVGTSLFQIRVLYH
ncbi:hypothetical protein FRC05_009585 [Tulasnella sp. 425]|nr:hypothetical protein FRC05_009585 [Tulasnella sp. 425]